MKKNGASKTLCLQNQIYSMFSFTPWVKILLELSHSQKSECKDTVTNIFIKTENQAVKSAPSQDNLTNIISYLNCRLSGIKVHRQPHNLF